MRLSYCYQEATTQLSFISIILISLTNAAGDNIVAPVFSILIYSYYYYYIFVLRYIPKFSQFKIYLILKFFFEAFNYKVNCIYQLNFCQNLQLYRTRYLMSCSYNTIFLTFCNYNTPKFFW